MSSFKNDAFRLTLLNWHPSHKEIFVKEFNFRKAHRGRKITLSILIGIVWVCGWQDVSFSERCIDTGAKEVDGK